MLYLCLDNEHIRSEASMLFGGGGGYFSPLTAPRAGGVRQALVPGGGQRLNCKQEGDDGEKPSRVSKKPHHAPP